MPWSAARRNASIAAPHVLFKDQRKGAWLVCSPHQANLQGWLRTERKRHPCWAAAGLNGRGFEYLKIKMRERKENTLRKIDTLLGAEAIPTPYVSEERFRVALKNSPVVVFNQDQELRYIWINSPILGWAVQDYLGKTDAQIVGGDEGIRLMRS